MAGDIDIAPVAALIGEPARSAILTALADGRALAATTLAAEAGLAPSTASGHLSRLVEGGLLRVETSGRHRYFRLAGPEVARALEALALLSPTQAVRSLRQSRHAQAIRAARTCYDHLAGRLGVAILDALVSKGTLRVRTGDTALPDPPLGPGREHEYLVTGAGQAELSRLGVNLDRPTRRPATRYCIDWSEQRPHLGGALGAALFERFVSLGWIVRGERREVTVTPVGLARLAEELGLDTGPWAPRCSAHPGRRA